MVKKLLTDNSLMNFNPDATVIINDSVLLIYHIDFDLLVLCSELVYTISDQQPKNNQTMEKNETETLKQAISNTQKILTLSVIFHVIVSW